MTYILYGSHTSPFVRRIRMLMENIPYEFKEVNIFDSEEGLKFNKINPINQLPVLVDGDQVIWDSRQIFNYVNLNHKLHNLHWDDENLLTAIEGAMNSAINLMMMKRSGMNVDEQYMFINRQKERVESVLDFLKPLIETRFVKEWDFHAMSLYAFIDWLKFRNVIPIDKRPELQKFMDAHAERPIVKKTAIPQV